MSFVTVLDMHGNEFFAQQVDPAKKLPPAVKLTDINQSMEHGVDSPFNCAIMKDVMSDGVIVTVPVTEKLFGSEWIIYDDGYQPCNVVTDSNFKVTYLEI